MFQIHGKRKEISLERESKSRHPERDRRSWDTERKKEKIKQKKSSLVADCFLYIRANKMLEEFNFYLFIRTRHWDGVGTIAVV